MPPLPDHDPPVPGSNVALRDFGNFITSSVPYYRSHPLYSSARRLDSSSLSSLPILAKTDIRAHALQMIPDSLVVSEGLSTGTLAWTQTSGSAGERTQILCDEHVYRMPPCPQAFWGVDFDIDNSRTAVLTTPRCMAIDCSYGRSHITHRTTPSGILYIDSTADLFGVSDDIVARFVDDLHAFSPDILEANPAYLHWFSLRAQQIGLVLPHIPLILTTYQYRTNHQYNTLRRIYKSSIIGMYSSTELGGWQIAVQCIHGNWHIREDHVFVEFDNLRDTINGDKIGSIIVTNFRCRVTPLLRYTVGDIGRISSTTCHCVNNMWRCIEIHGRESDILIVADRIVTTKQFDDILSTFEGIAFYQGLQDKSGAITLAIIPEPDTSLDLNALRQMISAALGCHVAVRLVSRLATESSEKYRLLKRL